MSTTNSARRKSFVFFSRPSLSLSEEASERPPRPKSALFGGGAALPDMSSLNSRQRLTKPQTAPKSKSVFGGLNRKDKDKGETRVVAAESETSSSLGEDGSEGWSVRHKQSTSISSIVLHSGEMVTSGGLLRKKKEYIVLTNRELLRYKSEHKANEAFGLSQGGPKSGGIGRATSIASLEVEHGHTLVTLMDQVVAVYHPGGDAEAAGCSIQLDYFDSSSMGTPSSTVLMAATPADAQAWVTKLRQVAASAREAAEPVEFARSTIDHIVGKLDAEKDYSPSHFQIFRVTQRSTKAGSKTSSIDDLQKMYSTICYLAIGIHKVHLVPVKVSTSKNASAVPALTSSSFAIMNLCHLAISACDDGMTMSFRSPCRPASKLILASVHAAHIIQSIRQAAEYLRPMWQISPFVIDIPESMKDEPLPEIPPTPGDDLGGFDRTLAAYCTAYGLDASNIVYGIHMDVEDAPQFILYPPAHSRRRQYSDLELLAIMRTLRWNDSICSISFARIPLDPLVGIVDTHGREYEPRYLKGGSLMNLKVPQDNKSLLVHELRALALYNGKLRRLDFSECITKGKDPRTQMGAQGDKACGIIEAIMPLCRRGLTNVDWFVLTGIELSEADLDWMIDAAASRLAHFRGFELSRCALSERMLTLFLNALTAHENTLECLDLSGNPSRMHSPSLNNLMCYFPFLRKLNLSRLLRMSGTDAGLTAETLLRWRLEDLDLSETKLNTESVDAVAAYLASPQSDSLRHLALTQCGLTGKDIAVLMHSMQRTPGKPRHLHLYVGQNSLSAHNTDLLSCISSGTTPTHLTMRMVDYPREELFQDLIRAVTKNTSLVYLDISKTSLPYEASETTCLLLGEMFAHNNTLLELDVSGEQAVLESASLGKGLVSSLARIAENTTLEVLRIELQALGTPGAMELASLLSTNTSLRQLYCEQNDIHLSGFTALVNALQSNHSLIYLPEMARDRADHVRALKEKLFQSSAPPVSTPKPTKEEGHHHHPKLPSSFRRASKSKKVTFAEKGAEVERVEQSLMLLEEKWQSETERLRGYLRRNVVEAERRRVLKAREPRGAGTAVEGAAATGAAAAAGGVIASEAYGFINFGV